MLSGVRSRAAWCALIVAASLVFGPRLARAELPADIEVNETGACPRDKLAGLPSAIPGRPLGQERLAKGLGYTFSIKSEVALRKSVGRTSDTIRPRLALFERVLIFGEDAQSQRLLVGKPDLSVCGWAEPATLLMREGQGVDKLKDGPLPVKMKEGPDKVNHAENELNIKVVVQNLKRKGEEGADLLSEPGGRQSIRKIKLFFVYEVFDWKEATDPQSNQKRNYFLIGRSGDNSRPGLDASNSELIGWINEDEVYVWSSRVAAFWAKTGEAKGYLAKDMLNSSDFAIEEPKALREPQDKTLPRFPVIEQEPTANELLRKAKANTTPQDLDRQLKYYRIAMPGMACERQQPQAGAAGAPPQRNCVDAADQDRSRLDLDETMRKLSTIDVLFVVDATKSMEPYFPAVRSALQEFLAKLDTNDTTFRAGVAIYGDYTTATPNTRDHQYVVVIPFRSKADGLERELSRLDGLKMYDDVHADKPEASFAAIVRAATTRNAFWSQNAGIRYLVHIGDHGNREPGKPSGALNLVDNLTVNEVAAALETQSIIYVPIPVLGTYSAENNRAFVRQAKEIRAKVPRLSTEPFMTYRDGELQESAADRKNKIIEALRSGVDISLTLRQSMARNINCAQNADNPVCRQGGSANTPSWMGDIVRGLTERHGISEDQIRDIYSRSQTVGSYYFKPFARDNRSVFSFWLSLDETSLGRMQRVTSELCDNIDRTDAARYLRRAISEAVDAGSGDNSASPAELLAKKLFIPAYYSNPLLLKSWEEIEDELRYMDRQRLDESKKSFCKSAKLLTWVRSGDRVDNPDDPEQMRWDQIRRQWDDPNNRRKRYKWIHDGAGGLQLYYIPLKYLPQ